MANVIYSLIWLLIIIFIAFWVAFFCAPFYIILNCIVPCLPPLSGLAEILLQAVNFPRYCAEKMLNGAPLG